ncbi:unnamed protein product [Parnassius mnemosyne]|uniref:Uncharacterized protein n=1 Tax=Parnassius mnemosyne TaxID=213953 RepID=A0AAV1MCX7_9NEOP
MSSEFLVSLVILDDIMGITLHLSRSLHAIEVDVLSATQLVNMTKTCLQRQRDTSTGTFKRNWNRNHGFAELSCKE